MEQKLIAAIVNCGYVEGETLIKQGTLDTNKPYPDNFVTIWTDYTADNSHFDNRCVSLDWNFSVIVYSNDPEQLTVRRKELIEALRAAGFIPQGVGQDIPSGAQSHTGWAMEFIGVENL